MILQDIVGFLRAREVASIAEIARAVGSTPDAVRGMLQTLQERGLVDRYAPPPGCGIGCRQCAQAGLELYCPGGAARPEDAGGRCAAAERH